MHSKDSIEILKGIGQKRARMLKKFNIYTIEDLLLWLPRVYDDRSDVKQIRDLSLGENQTFKARVLSVEPNILLRGRLVTKATLMDETGYLEALWYGKSFIANRMIRNKEYIFTGKLQWSINKKIVQHPDIDELENNLAGEILPVYSTTKDLSQKTWRKLLFTALYESKLEIEEFLPKNVLDEYDLCEIKDAYRYVHFPKNFQQVQEGRKRLVFNEMLIFQLGLFMFRNMNQQEGAAIVFTRTPIVHQFIDSLPYQLTEAQIRVYQEIKKDMESPRTMNRLIQGDVGSGKTIVALLSLLKAVQSGYQGALMVPTEVLARQHFCEVKKLFESYGIEADLLVGSLTKKQKLKVYDELKTGKINIVVGTHALIEDGVEFQRLGLIVTDEQHRFGVKQRLFLFNKGMNPDVLVMSATPIPRTLSLILYGDLEVSVIDELPKGRQSIDTFVVDENYRERIHNFIIQQVQQGRQIYIVCPMVEASEHIDFNDLKSVTEHAEFLQQNDFSGISVASLHGKMKAQEKNSIMSKFVAGEIQILVSTTVIEVGVNVPNATIILIENAERFGLAQLHQLRGRVGRGIHKSYCILMSESMSSQTKERLNIMKKTNNGFEIAQKDLELRGPGELFGTKQHGIPEFKVTNLYKDMRWIQQVVQLSQSLYHIIELKEDKQYSKLIHYVEEYVRAKIDEVAPN